MENKGRGEDLRLTDFELPLYAAFASLSVHNLTRVVLIHYFDKFPWEGGVLQSENDTKPNS